MLARIDEKKPCWRAGRRTSDRSVAKNYIADRAMNARSRFTFTDEPIADGLLDSPGWSNPRLFENEVGPCLHSKSCLSLVRSSAPVLVSLSYWASQFRSSRHSLAAK